MGRVCVTGGYKTVTPVQIANCVGAYKRDAISYRAVRVYFGCLALIAVREGAKRSAKSNGRKSPDLCHYKPEELCRITGLEVNSIRRELRKLEAEGLIVWRERSVLIPTAELPGNETLLKELSCKRSSRRPVPVPRVLLRFIARTPKMALATTAIAYAVRGLSIDRYDSSIRSSGTVKSSWIAEAFGLSIRSVKASRKVLIDLRFIERDTGSFQRKLNRDGAYFKINLAWNPRGGTPPKSAPRRAASHPKFAPPYKYRKTSYEIKNQKPENCALPAPGTRKQEKEEEANLRNVVVNDLKSVPRVWELFKQGAKLGWTGGSEPEPCSRS